MEVLDISVANVALPHIAGDLSASQDESTWTLTSYLVTNAIVMPISGWLSERFGRKRFFITCISGFTIASLLCGLSVNLGMLVVLRAIQGAAGGGLQPTGQAILTDAFPRSNAVWQLPFTAWQLCLPRQSVRPSAAGSLIPMIG